MKSNIKVKSLENVQGDEADIVILSVSYGPNKEGKIRCHFGPLTQQNGMNRLNVAITRAKQEMYVVKSIYGKDIPPSDNENNNVFKYFLDYVDNRAGTKVDHMTQNLVFDSTFEQEVFQEIEKVIDSSKYLLSTQFPVGKKRIDIVLIDKETKLVKLGIEVDGLKYHSGLKKTMEDIDRQNFLEDLGYRIYRVLEIEWHKNKKGVIKSISKLI